MSWQTIKVPASEHPNVREGREAIPGGPSQEWVEDVRSEYGEGSPYYVARVEAEFPEESQDALARREWIEAAIQRHRDGTFQREVDDSYYRLGVDVARHGSDRTVVAVRRGPRVVEFRDWQGLDTQETAARVRAAARELAEEAPVPEIVVDVVGIGAGVVDRLEEDLDLTWYEAGRSGRGLRKKSTRVREFNGGSKAKLSDRFFNLRAQSFWHLRKRLENDEIALPDNGKVGEEIWKTRVEYTSDGRTKIEAKENLRGRLGRSPDYADAVSMTYLSELDDGTTVVRWV